MCHRMRCSSLLGNIARHGLLPIWIVWKIVHFLNRWLKCVSKKTIIFCLIDLKKSQCRHTISTMWKKHLSQKLTFENCVYIYKDKKRFIVIYWLKSFTLHMDVSITDPIASRIVTHHREGSTSWSQNWYRNQQMSSQIEKKETHLCTFISYINQLCLFILSYRTLINE